MLKLLSDTDYSELEFTLEFRPPFILTQEMILRLRREFIHMVRTIASARPERAVELMAMLDPALSPDPYARRIFQKSAPPFIIHPPVDIERTISAGNRLTLSVGFIGTPGVHVPLFVELLHLLGESGLYRGEGRFQLVAVAGKDQSGNLYDIAMPAGHNADPVIPQTSLAWLMEARTQFDRKIRLNFLTPARLLSHGKPLFRISFTEIFPFMLRRVSSMLHAWGGIELFADPPYLLKTAGAIEADASTLSWSDWRTLEGESVDQDIGGIIGHITLDGVDSEEIRIVLALAQLFNIGKGAAYGGGSFSIRTFS